MVLDTATSRHHIGKSSAAILRAADRAEPKIRRAMLAALQDLEGKVPNLTGLIEAGNTDAVMSAISGLTTDPKLVAAITDATVTAAATAGLPEATRIGLAFNEPNRRAIRWAELNAAKNIKAGNVLPGVRDAIRSLVVNATENGIHPYKTARMVEGLVPLLPRHAKAVQRVAQGAIDSGLTEAHIERLVARKTKKLLRYRANMIARTEAVKAANMGQQVVWQSAIDEGLIPQGTKKVWVATGDSRTCPICAVMDGQIVEVSGEYNINRQATGFTRQGSDFRVAGTKPLKRPAVAKVPPAHPQCRCTVVLETIPTPRQGFGGDRRRSATPKVPERVGPDPFAQFAPKPPTPKPSVPKPTAPARGRTPLKSWDEYGAKVPRDKARREVVEQGLKNLDDLDDAVRNLYVGLLDKFDGGINFPVATKSTKSVGYYGKVTQPMPKGRIGGKRKLDMHLSRPNEKWEEWVQENNRRMKDLRELTPEGRWAGKYIDDPAAHEAHRVWREATEPDKWRLATTDEFTDVLVHELTHAADFEKGIETGTQAFRGGAFTRQLPAEIKEEVWIMRHGGDRNWKRSGITPDPKIRDAYEYATSEPAEMIAELGRFYNEGVSDLGVSAVEWRQQNPAIANWVEETFYT